MAACTIGSRHSRVLAQGPSLSPAQRILAGYLAFPGGSLPAGLKPQAISPVPNSLAAAQASDPVEVQAILDRARLDGLEQEFLQSLAGSAAHLEVDVILFRDSVGADADATDPGGATAVPAPSYGDVSAGFTLSAGDKEVTALSFAVGRLEVQVNEFGLEPARQTRRTFCHWRSSWPSRLPFHRPLRRPTNWRFCRRRRLRNRSFTMPMRCSSSTFLQPLPPSQLLAAAYSGASTTLTNAGVTGIASAPRITASDLDTAWGQFLPAYQALEAQAPSSLSPQNLAYAAASAMYSNLNCHTHFDSPSVYSNLIESLQATAQAGTGFDLWLSADHSTVAIERVQPGSPADQAGLQAGDVIQAINHQSLAEAAPRLDELLNGPAGSSITLTVQRSGVAQPFDATVVLQPLQPLYRAASRPAGRVGYIELDGFDDGDVAFDAVSSALNNFQAAG